jgi:ribosomal protein L1
MSSSFNMIRPNQPHMLVDRFGPEQDSIRSQLTKAITAIQKYAEKKETERNENNGTVELISDPETMTISFSLDKIPVKKDYRFHDIVVPHNVVDIENKTICLLVRDPKEKAVEAVSLNKLPIEKVIPVKSLKRKYVSNMARRELANRFDVFMCESQIYEMMGSVLGKYFFQTKKSKIPMPLKNLSKECFDKTLRTARFRIRGGAVVGVRIGNRGMSVQELVGNAFAAVQYMATQFCTDAKTFNNIYNIAVGATNVIDLPVWSVPVESSTTSEEEKQAVVAVETPKKSTATKVTPSPENIADVPVKKLKQVQKQRVEKAKEELKAPDNKKKPRRV